MIIPVGLWLIEADPELYPVLVVVTVVVAVGFIFLDPRVQVT
jgi:hypothetical protein